MIAVVVEVVERQYSRFSPSQNREEQVNDISWLRLYLANKVIFFPISFQIFRDGISLWDTPQSEPLLY